jgi:hypothetical protein
MRLLVWVWEEPVEKEMSWGVFKRVAALKIEGMFVREWMCLERQTAGCKAQTRGRGGRMMWREKAGGTRERLARHKF